MSLLLDPRYHDLLSIVKGFRNGVVYGAKVRFTHALVMSILFQHGTWQKKASTVFQATKTHSLNLGKFVALYKTFLVLQKYLNRGKERKADSFWAGLLGGWIVFGDRNAINEQIVLYVASRVIVSFFPRDHPTTFSAPQPRPTNPLAVQPPPPRYVPLNKRTFEIYAALAWGLVMWLFEHRRESVQGGMASSMQYLYKDSDYWKGWRSFLLTNK
ncbi:peroxisomal membrane protein 4 [Atractiella rhizophila]|nr:peroxisomal membrane protein 4 [Atractiella rhizophila]